MVDGPVADDEMSFLLSITGSMVKIAGEALREKGLQNTDVGVAGLIIKYAAEIDKGNMATLAKLGPPLLQAFEALQMSPRSRAISTRSVSKENEQPIVKSPLQQLRDEVAEQRNKRAN